MEASRVLQLSITHEPPEELAARSSSTTSSSTCSTPGSLDTPHPRWQVSPRVDASDAHRPSFSRQSWTQHPTASSPTHPHPPPLLCSAYSPHDTSHCALEVGTHSAGGGAHQLQPDATPFIPSMTRASGERQRPTARHASVVSSPRAAQGHQANVQDSLVSPFAQVDTCRVSPTQASPPGGASLRRSPSLARTTSSRSLSEMSSGPAKGLSESPSQSWSDGACPAIPEVSPSTPSSFPANPLHEAPTWAPTHSTHLQTASHESGAVAISTAPPAGAAEGNNIAGESPMGSPGDVSRESQPAKVDGCMMQPAAGAEAARPPHSQEQPGRTPWWRIPASKFIPGLGPVPPLAVC